MREPRAYYNEIDPEAVAALKQLIADDVITPGDVDDRSIKEVMPDDVRGYTQHHFFAGAGLWSVGARRAGWPDRRPLWSGSCPCQGESLAGKRRGADDPRHLWPDFFRLISACRPAVVVGEQVAAAAGTHWLDGTCSDLESILYAARAVNIPACAVDAPHIRQRLYWLAVANSDSGRGEGRELRGPGLGAGADTQQPHGELGRSDGGVLADCNAIRQQQPQRLVADERGWVGDSDARSFDVADTESQRGGRDFAQWRPEGRTADGRSDARRDVVDAGSVGATTRGTTICAGRHSAIGTDGSRTLANALGDGRSLSPARRHPTIQEPARPGPPHRNGSFWADAEWINCHDGKARRAKPGVRMLVDGVAGRIGLWRLAGNSIVADLAAEVLAAFLEDEAEQHLRLALTSGVFA